MLCLLILDVRCLTAHILVVSDAKIPGGGKQKHGEMAVMVEIILDVRFEWLAYHAFSSCDVLGQHGTAVRIIPEYNTLVVEHNGQLLHFQVEMLLP